VFLLVRTSIGCSYVIVSQPVGTDYPLRGTSGFKYGTLY